MNPGMASPRSKAAKIQYTMSDYQLQLQFVKFNLKQILNLISAETQPVDFITLSASDLNSLRILLKPIRSDGSTAPQSLSSFAPFFSGASSTSKAKLLTIADWITSLLSTKQCVNTVDVCNLCKAVTIYGDEFLGKDIRMMGFEESYVYVNTAVSHLYISNCINCTIMVAAIENTCTLDKSEQVNLSVAANMIRVGNSVDCKLNMYVVERPILYGDSRHVVLGPHNVGYDELMTQIKRSKIPIVPTHIENWANPLLMMTEKDWYSLLSEKDYSKLELPPKFKDDEHVLAPPKYLEVLNMRIKALNDLSEKIKSEKLTPEQQEKLHNAIQGFFREWASTTREVKSIERLVKMIDESAFNDD